MDIETLLQHEEVYLTEVDQYAFSWRPLSQREYRVFMALKRGGNLPVAIVHDKVFEHCYLGESKLLDGGIPAGVTPSIGEYILWLAGDCSLEQVKNDIERIRDAHNARDVYQVMRKLVLTVFPTYSPREVDDWSRFRLIREFVLAEDILSERTEYKPLSLNSLSDKPKVDTEPAIDFNKENRDIARAMGPTRSEDPLMATNKPSARPKPGPFRARSEDKTLAGDQSAGRSPKKQLTKDQARKLDKLNRGR